MIDIAPRLAEALRKMITAHENLDENAPLDPGCPICTDGMVPKLYNTGPCAYHTAKRALAEWDAQRAQETQEASLRG